MKGNSPVVFFFMLNYIAYIDLHVKYESNNLLINQDLLVKNLDFW